MQSKKGYTAPGLLRAYEVINLVAENGYVTFTNIFKALDMPKSSLAITLNTLTEGGYLHHTPKQGYRLGLELFSLGNKALANLGLDIRNQADSVMDALVRDVGQTSFLGVLGGNEAVYISKTESNNKFETLYTTGRRVPFQTTGIGKALLAWRDEKFVRDIIAENKPSRYTDRAIISPDAFVEHLGTIRRHGYSVCNRETVEDTVAIAAPVFSKEQEAPIGGLSIVTPHERMTPELFAFASERIYGGAKLLSERLGVTCYPEFAAMSFKPA